MVVVCHPVHTGAGHLRRVGVGAVVAIAAHTVGGSLVGGATVDGTLKTLVVSLCWLEKSRHTCCSREGWEEKERKREEKQARRQRNCGG